MDEGGVVYGDRFRAVAYVARRPWATVFRAIDSTDGALVALAVVPDDLAPGPTFAAHLEAEVERAGSFSHPNVAEVLAVGEEDGDRFVVEGWEDGATLAEVVAARGPLPSARVAELMSDLAAGLGAAHAAGVVHSGPSPGDVWLVGGPGGAARLHGFALQHAILLACLDAGVPLLGERAYLAPERLAGTTGDPATDLYGVGAVAFEALTGRAPFGRDGRPPEADLPFPSDLVAGVPQGLEDIVLDLLEAEPADRYHDADELLVDLEPFCNRQLDREKVSVGGAAGAALAEEDAVGAAPLDRRRMADGEGADAYVAGGGADEPIEVAESPVDELVEVDEPTADEPDEPEVEGREWNEAGWDEEDWEEGETLAEPVTAEHEAWSPDAAADDDDGADEPWDDAAADGELEHESWSEEGWSDEGDEPADPDELDELDEQAWSLPDGGEWVPPEPAPRPGLQVGPVRIGPLVGAGIVAVALLLVAGVLVVLSRATDDGDSGGGSDTAASDESTTTTEATTSTTAAEGTIAVPDQVGVGLFQAAEALTAAGFSPLPELRVDPTGQRGVVVEQSPPAGTMAPPGTQVTIIYTQPEAPAGQEAPAP